MSDVNEGEPLIDESIDRERRGEATPAELKQVAEWRRASLANEHEYRRLVRLLTVAHTLPKGAAGPTPSAAALLARQRPAVSASARPHRRAAQRGPLGRPLGDPDGHPPGRPRQPCPDLLGSPAAAHRLGSKGSRA